MVKLYIPENRYFTKTALVVESIRTSILLGYIGAGTRITEKQLKDLLKVSSSPIREAINQLEAEGLLDRSPHSGAKVTEIDIEDVKELYSIQSLLQGTAVQISTKKLKEEDINEAEKLNQQMSKLISGKIEVNELRILNYKFHMIVCGRNVYPWITRLISSLWIRLPSQTIWLVPNEPDIAIQYHNKIIQAIKKKDENQASALMKEHFQRSMKVLYG